MPRGQRAQASPGQGSRGRGLFPTGPVGWTDSAMLLSVPLDVCICAPFGDEDAVANELGLNDGYKDTCTILRRAWQKRNGASSVRYFQPCTTCFPRTTMHNENYVDARLYKAAMFKMIAMNVYIILNNYGLARRYIRQQLKYRARDVLYA